MRKGLSVVLGFVLLTVLAIVLVTGVMIWMRTTGQEAREGVDERFEEEDVKFYISRVNQDGPEINATIKNTGNFPLSLEELQAYYDGSPEDFEHIGGEVPIPPGSSANISITVS